MTPTPNYPQRPHLVESEREREYLFSRSFSAKRQRERDEAERDEAFDDDLIFCHFS